MTAPSTTEAPEGVRNASQKPELVHLHCTKCNPAPPTMARTLCGIRHWWSKNLGADLSAVDCAVCLDLRALGACTRCDAWWYV